MKELVFLCVNDFQDECEAEIMLKVKDIPHGTERIKAITKAYMAYFVQYPSVFNLFFVERLGDIGQKQPTASRIFTFLDRMCADDWNYCVQNQKSTENAVAIARQQLNYVSCGMLLFYMNRMQPESYVEFACTIDLQLNTILKQAEG